MARCPAHKDGGRPNFYTTDGVPCGHCFRCGHVRSWWDHVEARVGPGRAVIEELARMAGVPPLAPLNAEDAARWHESQVLAQRLEEILQAARRTLWTEEGDSVLEYLRSRGYSDDIIGLTELGAWPPELNEGTQKELSLDVPGAGTTHRLLVPMRTPAGRLAGFAVRFVGQLRIPRKSTTVTPDADQGCI